MESLSDQIYPIILERVQRRTTRFILSDYVSECKTRLLHLGIIPLMYMLDLYDIMFFIKALQLHIIQFFQQQAIIC